jgi:KDO2-lipid IV(A) lauroyltransferase
MPFFMLYRVSDFLAFMLNHVIGYRKEVIMNNLRNSFPEKSEEELNKIRIEFNKSFSDQMLETLKMFTISKKDLGERLVYETPDEITKWIEEGRSVVIASGHYGNWEYPSGFPFKLPGFDQYNIIYAPLSNKFFDKKIIETRERFGCHMVAMRNTFREILRLPDSGQFYGFIFDQSPHKGMIKYDLQFLNQTTPVHLGTEQVAVKKNAVVIYLEVRRTKRGYYSVKSELITDIPKETKKYEITNLLFNRLEKSIKKEPYLWLWSHRRWKHKKGIDYKI